MRMGVREGLGAFRLGVSFGDSSGQVKVLNTSKYKGDVALGDVTKVRPPRDKLVGVRKGAICSDRGGIGLGPRGHGVNCLFRGCTLFPAVAIRGGVTTKLGKGGRRGTGHIHRVVRGFRLAKLRGQFPTRLSKNRRREMTLTEVVTCGPSIVLLSRPFSTLSVCLGSHLRRRLRRLLRSCRNAIVVISRDESRICQFDRRLLVVSRKRVITTKGAGRLFRGPREGRTTQLAKYGGFAETICISRRATRLAS